MENKIIKKQKMTNNKGLTLSEINEIRECSLVSKKNIKRKFHWTFFPLDVMKSYKVSHIKIQFLIIWTKIQFLIIWTKI
jgi:hypothetical protein